MLIVCDSYPFSSVSGLIVIGSLHKNFVSSSASGAAVAVVSSTAGAVVEAGSSACTATQPADAVMLAASKNDNVFFKIFILQFYFWYTIILCTL